MGKSAHDGAERAQMLLAARAVRGAARRSHTAARPVELARPVHPLEFYEAEALERRYYYYVDLQGALFLDEHEPKGITTSLKDGRFLDFFFRQLRPNAAPEPPWQWLSPCGREQNFVRCADTPVVYTNLEERADGVQVLRYANSLEQPWRPELLRACEETGRLYHALESGRLAGGYALMASRLVQATIARRLHFRDGRFALDLEPAEARGGAREQRLPWLEDSLFRRRAPAGDGTHSSPLSS